MQEKDGFLRWSKQRWWRIPPESQRQKVAHALQYQIRKGKGEDNDDDEDSSVEASPCEEMKERNESHMGKLLSREVRHLDRKVLQPTPTERPWTSAAQVFPQPKTKRPKMDVEDSFHDAMAFKSKHLQSHKPTFHLTRAGEERCPVLSNSAQVDATISKDGRGHWRQDVSYLEARKRKRSTKSSFSRSPSTLSPGTPGGSTMPHFVVVSSSWELSRQCSHPHSYD